MNGKTSHDEKLNPCTADIDRHTYGCKSLNITFRGKRFFRVTLFRTTIDVWWRGFKRPLFATYGDNSWVWFHPLGSISRISKKQNTEAAGGE